jgi:uncharacterized membrane protein
MRNDPTYAESRWPAVAIWTITGLLVSLALCIVVGFFLILLVVGAVVGLSIGLFATRTKFTPEDD